MDKRGVKILKKIEKEIERDILFQKRKMVSALDGGAYRDGYGDSGYGPFNDCEWHEDVEC